jgi:hypothetical protein
MNRSIELLTENPYFYFNSNPVTDALLNNFDFIPYGFIRYFLGYSFENSFQFFEEWYESIVT